MKFTLIPDHEKSFETTLTDSSGKKFTVKETIDMGDGIVMRKIIPQVNSGFYYAEKTNKNMIVIHSTIGVVKGDIATLTNSANPVSVSYLIARSGVIYEIFNPHYWAYHLGKGTIGGNKINSSRSIGIELSNMGPLTNINGGLETVYSRKSYTTNGVVKTTAPDVYCSLTDTLAYTKLDTPYRTYQYFAAYTDAQYIALNKLVRRLSNEFNIPMCFVDETERFGPFKDSIAPIFSGICSHVNYRTGGKWDVGPDFKWDRIISDHIQAVNQSHVTDLASNETTTVPKTITTADPVSPKQYTDKVPLTPSTGLPPYLPTVQPIQQKSMMVPSIFTSFLKRFVK